MAKSKNSREYLKIVDDLLNETLRVTIRKSRLNESADYDFTPEQKDIDRAKSCLSDARASAQIQAIKDLSKLGRRCAAFMGNSLYGKNIQEWVDKATALGADQDYIDKLKALANPGTASQNQSSTASSVELSDEEIDNAINTTEASMSKGVDNTQMYSHFTEWRDKQHQNEARSHLTVLQKTMSVDDWSREYRRQYNLETAFWSKAKSPKISARHIGCLKLREAVVAGIRAFMENVGDNIKFDFISAWTDAFKKVSKVEIASYYSGGASQIVDKWTTWEPLVNKLLKFLAMTDEEIADMKTNERIASENAEQERNRKYTDAAVGEFVKKLNALGYNAKYEFIEKKYGNLGGYNTYGPRGPQSRKSCSYVDSWVIIEDTLKIRVSKATDTTAYAINGQIVFERSPRPYNKTEAWTQILKLIRASNLDFE